MHNCEGGNARDVSGIPALPTFTALAAPTPSRGGKQRDFGWTAQRSRAKAGAPNPVGFAVSAATASRCPKQHASVKATSHPGEDGPDLLVCGALGGV